MRTIPRPLAKTVRCHFAIAWQTDVCSVWRQPDKPMFCLMLAFVHDSGLRPSIVPTWQTYKWIMWVLKIFYDAIIFFQWVRLWLLIFYLKKIKLFESICINTLNDQMNMFSSWSKKCYWNLKVHLVLHQWIMIRIALANVCLGEKIIRKKQWAKYNINLTLINIQMI